MRGARWAIVALVFASWAGAAAPAGATPAPADALSVAFTLPSTQNGLWLTAAGNCLILTGGWSQLSTAHYVGTTLRPRGLLDLATHTGEAIVPGEAIHVDRVFVPHPYARAASDMGIELAGRRAYLTGTIRRSRAHSIRTAPRRRLAALHGVTIAAATSHGRLVVTVRGRATMLAPLAGMFEQLRCRGPRIDEHPIRVGAALGAVKATIIPTRASAALTSFRLGFALGGNLPTPPHVEPTGGAQSDGDGVRLSVAPGSQVVASCTRYGCEPYDGHVPLQGGFDLSDGTGRLSLTDVVLDYAGGRRTVSATLGGARVVVGAELSDNGLLTIGDALKAQLATAFGDPDLGNGYLVGLQLPLGRLAPA
jgi:hypothetical protein